MKTGGIIALIFGILNIIAGIGMSSDPNFADKAGGKFGFGIGCIVLGIYLLNRASKKKEEQNEKDKWNNGEKQQMHVIGIA